jgi:hypothetical protein
MSPPRRRGTQTRRKPNARRRPATGRDFWGTDEPEDDELDLVRPSDDPAAMVNSLGPPPLPGHETAAQHYFEAVYEKAASLAVALAAANELLATDDRDEDLV